MLQAGKEPVVEGSIVKDLGTVWEEAARARNCTARPEVTNRTGRTAHVRDPDRSQAHHSGQHHGGPAGHHRRGPALNPPLANAVASETFIAISENCRWPRSVAVIGASSGPRGLRGRVRRYERPSVRRADLPGEPQRTEVQGLKAYRSVMPAHTDLAVLIIPANSFRRARRAARLEFRPQPS